MFMKSQDTQRSSPTRSWPLILNRFFIGIGVLAFAFFVTSKVMQVFNEDDSPVVTESQADPEQTLVLISKDSDVEPKVLNFSNLETLFGTRIVFVSASEPAYLITEDLRRFQVGDIPTTGIEVTDISSTQLVLKQGEESIVFDLPIDKVN